jgi:pimeloyl-ACP methyl ester carboxylesterase
MAPFVWGAHVASCIPGVGALLQHIRPFVYRALGGHDYLHTNGIKKEIYKTITQQDLTHFLPTIQTPTLVLWGAQDTYTPVRYGQKIASLLPHSKFVVFKDGKHGLHHTHISQILAAIQDFVSK